jgi:hypothetical protein
VGRSAIGSSQLRVGEVGGVEDGGAADVEVADVAVTDFVGPPLDCDAGLSASSEQLASPATTTAMQTSAHVHVGTGRSRT